MDKYKLVPIIPTSEMFAAGCAAWGINEIYDAMLAAAPDSDELTLAEARARLSQREAEIRASVDKGE